MRPLKQILFAFASVALPGGAAPRRRRAPGPEDVAAVRNYVARNRAYTPGEPGRGAAPARAAARPRRRSGPLRARGRPYRRACRQRPQRAAAAAMGVALQAQPGPARPVRRRPLRRSRRRRDRGRLVGRRVLRINGHDWREIRAAYARYQGGEPGFRDQFVTLFMELPALLAAAGFGTDPDLVELRPGAARRGGRRAGARRRRAVPLSRRGRLHRRADAARRPRRCCRRRRARSICASPSEPSASPSVPEIDARLCPAQGDARPRHIDAFLDDALAELRRAAPAQHRRRPQVQHGRRPQHHPRFHAGAAGPGRRAGGSTRSPRGAPSPPPSRASAICARRRATAWSSSASRSATGSNSGRKATSCGCPASAA